MKKINISLCQFEIKYQNPYENWLNLKNSLSYLIKTPKIGKIITLPELCFFGVVKSKKEIMDFCREINEIIREISIFTIQNDITIILTMPKISENEMLFNTTYVFQNEKIIEAYNKINLFPPMREELLFERGEPVPPLSLNINGMEINVGFLTCFDLRYPELARYLSLLGAEIIFVNALWPVERINHFVTLLQARALENQIYIVGVNSYGRSGNYFFGGKSCIIAPDGAILALMDDKDNFLTQDIYMDYTERIRQKFNTSFSNLFSIRYQNKIHTLDRLKKILEKRKKAGQKMVFTNGCFDLLHAGHVSYLKEARKCGDFLVVGLNSDDSIRRIKGEKRPINNEILRAKVLENLESVDYIIFFEEDTPINLITSLIPDVLVKGADWKEDEIVGADFVKSHGGVVKTIKFEYDISTTKLIEKINQ